MPRGTQKELTLLLPEYHRFSNEGDYCGYFQYWCYSGGANTHCTHPKEQHRYDHLDGATSCKHRPERPCPRYTTQVQLTLAEVS